MWAKYGPCSGGSLSSSASARPASMNRLMICPSICLLLVWMSPRTPLYLSKANSHEAYSGPYSLTTSVKCICICMFWVTAALPKSCPMPFANCAKCSSTFPSTFLSMHGGDRSLHPCTKCSQTALRRDNSMKTVPRGYQRLMSPFCRCQ